MNAGAWNCQSYSIGFILLKDLNILSRTAIFMLYAFILSYAILTCVCVYRLFWKVSKNKENMYSECVPIHNFF